MDQDKHGEQYTSRNEISLKSLAQIPGPCRSYNGILRKRKHTSVSLRSLQADLRNPIKKKLKLEGELQEGYELKIKTFAVRDENGKVTIVKKEEDGPNFNVKLEDSHSQTADQENPEKPKNLCYEEEFARKTKEQAKKDKRN
jgi:hypothetical protein